MTYNWLNDVRKPSRYINGEVNAIHKPDAETRVCLAFPDTYEVGMSHIGMKILYGLINAMPGAAAERCFAPWLDMEAALRHRGETLRSLESGLPLREFDAIGFSLQYELSFTNVLQMLDLSGIAFHSEDRAESDPIILAGGPCAMNPAPMSRFIDAFLVGDGEEAVPAIVDAIAQTKGMPRMERLRALSAIDGVYAPLLHRNGNSSSPVVRRRVVENLDAAYFPTSPVVAHQAVHNRVAIEIGRGCPRGCRFCQAGIIYRPLRERSMETVIRIAGESVRNTGFQEVSFTSLSAGDYGCLFPLIRAANSRFKGRHIAISLPSLRVGSLNRESLRLIKDERKTGFTIAPEAGTERLRRVINKQITAVDYTEGLRMLFEEGWETLKLYFMIGLPTETDDDIEGIISMVKEAGALARGAGARRVNVNVGVSTFVPKPHTPFQWMGQIPLDEIYLRQGHLRRALMSRKFSLKTHKPEMSMLEAVFSRGGVETGALVEAAYNRGCRFDGWSDAFDFGKWQAVMAETGIGPEYAQRNFEAEEKLPWGVVDPGVSAKFLWREYERSLEAERSPECREKCLGCGMGCKGLNVCEEPAQPLDAPPAPKLLPVPVRFRFRYSKRGPSRFLSHLEMKETLIRAFRKAGMMPDYSKGFHPQARLSFGSALGVGISSIAEYADVELLSPIEPSAAVRALNMSLPGGMEVLEMKPLAQDALSLSKLISRYDYIIDLPTGGDAPHGGLPEGFTPPEKLLDAEMPVERENEAGQRKTVDLRPLIQSAEIRDGRLYLTVADKNGVMARIHEIVGRVLRLEDAAVAGLAIERTGQH